MQGVAAKNDASYDISRARVREASIEARSLEPAPPGVAAARAGKVNRTTVGAA
jgi:hypothetical protein